MKLRNRFLLISTITILFLTMAGELCAKRSDDAMLLERLWKYASTVDTSGFQEAKSYAYQKYYIKTDKRNPTLMLVPSLYVISKGNREYIGEVYDEVEFNGFGKFKTNHLAHCTTVPRRKKTLPKLLEFLTPQVYDVTILKQDILSPFNRHNRYFYKYRVKRFMGGMAEIRFRPRTNNTELVKGVAYVEAQTGRIVQVEMSGEHDMLRFTMKLLMGSEGMKTLLPARCEVDAKFKFLNNQISNKYLAIYDLQRENTDTVRKINDPELMASLRPETLKPEEQDVYDLYYTYHPYQETPDTVKREKRNWTKRVLWDIIGDNVFNRVKSNFGSENQGYLRINPILNPLYLGYSDNKGLIYKFDLKLRYNFSERFRLSTRVKAGYMFKREQFYYRVPVTLTYSKSKNRYLYFETSNGNWVKNGAVNRQVEEILGDDYENIDKNSLYFRDHKYKLMTNYDIDRYTGFQVGITSYKRIAVDKKFFESLGMLTTYRSSAPYLEIAYRPMGYQGPVITANYERSFKGLFGANLGYERWEFDGQYVHRLHSLRFLKMRAGFGFYTDNERGDYFLDYENFRENNLEGGWDDEWSGEFELLDSYRYNQSDYYMRLNCTFESPLLVLSWFPYFGHYIETERFYLSGLNVRDIHPYTELGYGFSTRLFSMGAFVSFNEARFERVGFKFGFELFRDW